MECFKYLGSMLTNDGRCTCEIKSRIAMAKAAFFGPVVRQNTEWMKLLIYVEVLEDKITMHIRVTLYWGHLIVLWLFYLVCILYCGCFNLFCNVWVCVCVGFLMCGCFDNCVGVLVICVLVFTVFCIACTVFLYCFFYAYLFLFVTSVKTTATEWKLNCSK